VTHKQETYDLFGLLELYVKETHFQVQEHQKRIAFFSTLASAIVIATVAALTRVEDVVDHLALIVGPLMVFAVAQFGEGSSFRFYQRFLEVLSTRYKIEQSLNMHNSTWSNHISESCWKDEPLIPIRHVISEREFATSAAFVQGLSEHGYQKYAKHLFVTYKIISVILLIILVYSMAQVGMRAVDAA